jgi:hypothetical protein
MTETPTVILREPFVFCHFEGAERPKNLTSNRGDPSPSLGMTGGIVRMTGGKGYCSGLRI